MTVAGYKTVISVGSSVPVSVTAEACTSLSASVYRVTTSARRVLDPGNSVTVKDGGVTVSSSLYSIEYLTGKITFSGYSPGGAITVDAYYIPMVALTQCDSAEFSVSNDLLNVTPYATAGVKVYQQGLQEAAMTFGGFTNPASDLAGDGVAGITAYMAETTPRVWRLSFAYSSSTAVFQVWGKFQDNKQAAPHDGITKLTCTIVGTARSGKACSVDTWS